jgi:hypothetical protein
MALTAPESEEFYHLNLLMSLTSIVARKKRRRKKSPRCLSRLKSDGLVS